MGAGQGILILESIPDKTTEDRVRKFLEARVKNISPDTLTNLLKNTPVILSRRVPEEVGRRVADYLKELGASASFIDNPELVPENAGPSAASTETSKKAHPAKDGEHRQDTLKTAAMMKEEADKELAREQEYEKGLLERVGADHPVESAGQERSHLDEIPGLETSTAGPMETRKQRVSSASLAEQFANVNKELWVILTMVAVAGLMNYIVASKYMILGLYTFPTILSAYFYGRRHAVMTATLTIIIVGVMTHFNGSLFKDTQLFGLGQMQTWYHIGAWGCTLVCTAYAMGTLYERHVAKVQELRKTYQGLIVILRHFISKDKYTENHCYRVSIYAAKIASYLGLSEEEIEDIRSAGLLHDIGKLDVSRELLYKAAKLSESEYKEIKKHVSNSEKILEPVKGPLGRIIPIILAHHDKYDGRGYHPLKGEEIPLGARILAVADVYDALTSDRPYRKAMPPMEVKEIIVKGAGKDFDPVVVQAFVKAFERGEMEIPHVVV